MDSDRIEESGERLFNSSSGGSSSGSRWVDGSEVYWEGPSWSRGNENEGTEGYGTIRRRLVKKPKRVDSFDVEAMEIAGSHGHHAKVIFRFSGLGMPFLFLSLLLLTVELDYLML